MTGDNGGRAHGTVDGVVRVWHADEGWGVVDAADTPGGCRADTSSLEEGWAPRAGEPVALEWRRTDWPTDGLSFEAVSVRRRGDDVLGAAPGA